MAAYQKVMLRLKRNPKEFLACAQRGNLPEAIALGNFWQDFPELLSLGLLDVFFHHTDDSKAPIDSSANHMDKPVQLAFASFVGLAKVGEFWDAGLLDESKVLKAWPGIFTWSEYFFVARVLPVGVPDGLRQGTMDSIASTWYGFLKNANVRQAMADTPGAIELATHLWIREGTGSVPSFATIPVTSSMFDSLLKFADDSALDRVVEAMDGKVDNIAQIALNRLRAAIKGPNLDAMEMLIFTDTINTLCREPRNGLRDAFLRFNVIHWVTKGLAAISTNIVSAPDPKSLAAMLSCLGFLSNYIESTDGFTWVLQSINAGLISAYADCSPVFNKVDLSDREDIIIPIFDDIIPRYMVFRSVVCAVDGAIFSVDQSNRRGKLERSPAGDAWRKFYALTLERRAFLAQHHLLKDKAIICDNTKCQRMDDKNAFRKCSACLCTFYCSKECQAIAWKQGDHKSMCKLKQQERIEHKAESITKQDIRFLHHLTLQDGARNLPHLRALAAREFPGIPYHSLVISINYNFLPPTFSLKPIDTYTGQNIRGTTNGEDRHHALVQKTKEHPGKYVLVEAMISFGEGDQLILTLAKGDYWDSKDGYDELVADEMDQMMARIIVDNIMKNLGSQVKHSESRRSRRRNP
ncbi:hypothetical protein JAAARDRAFT_54674 [Jaapia argillacea MUCL 33604]|uniref:MYND-type domain-containing protein n=1 Tax=Jaapia argillacea MUCL 33604 TaxID=933084 RepID=A0A067Q731_9AGAM|nr:hypothetical protein JAAARDRAFT_54674 [Jaapia argillacea MUCL 33604]